MTVQLEVTMIGTFYDKKEEIKFLIGSTFTCGFFRL